MITPGPTHPDVFNTDLQFPEVVQPPYVDLPKDRFETLANQAFVLEFAANSMLAAYSPLEIGSDLWIAHQAPELVTYHQGAVPELHAGVVETRITMAQEFAQRVANGEVSTTDLSRILSGLVAFEDPGVAQAVNDVVAVYDEASDPYEVPGYLESGNNAAAFILRDIPGVDGKAILKIGYSVEDELSNCDQAAYTNLRRWLGLMAGKDIEGFEQPVAFSAERALCVTKLVSGMELFEIANLISRPQPSEGSLQRFANTFYESIVKRITIDVSGRDLLYDPDTDELTVIDHSAPSRAYSRTAANCNETTNALVETFKASFGYEFDEVGFRRLLEEFSGQGLHDLRT